MHKTTSRILLTFLAGFFVFSDLKAAIKLPGFFSDHMVLQRNAVVPLWGWCRAGQTITITNSWSNDTVRVVASGNARWKMNIKTPDAGGPYRINITDGSETVSLNDVLIGEVWLCSGQSNMQWSALNKLPQMEEELPNATNNQIRFLQVTQKTAPYPQDDIADSWVVNSPEHAKYFSAIGYFMAKKLQKELGVPVGVINSSWGGTTAEVWVPPFLIENSPLIKEQAAKVGPAAWWPNTPGDLWNTMIYPLAGYKIAGACWYQGESNVAHWPSYNLLFSGLIQTWRQAWGYDFPFYFVQIAPFAYEHNQAQQSPFLREQQTKTLSLPNTGMVVTTDLVDDIKDIHPIKKKEVAERLADLALAETYNKKLVDYKSPVFDRYTIEKNKIIIHFKYLEGPLVIKGKELTDIVIAGADGTFFPATAKVEKNTLVVTSNKVSDPKTVRFGFTDVAMPNLFNSKGLPVAPFRTDK